MHLIFTPPTKQKILCVIWRFGMMEWNEYGLTLQVISCHADLFAYLKNKSYKIVQYA